MVMSHGHLYYFQFCIVITSALMNSLCMCSNYNLNGILINFIVCREYNEEGKEHQIKEIKVDN